MSIPTEMFLRDMEAVLAGLGHDEARPIVEAQLDRLYAEGQINEVTRVTLMRRFEETKR